MIHEILKILDTTELQELEKQRITTDLLRLFNVVGRSELLLAFAKQLQPKEDVSLLMNEVSVFLHNSK